MNPLGVLSYYYNAMRMPYGHRLLSQADREFIGEMNIFTLINLVLSRLVQSSRSSVVRGDNEALFFRAARFSLLFSFKPPPKTLPFKSPKSYSLSKHIHTTYPPLE